MTTPVPTTYPPFTIPIVTGVQDAYVHTHQRVARRSDGRLFVVYMDSTERYLRCRTSDDDGATWSGEVTVRDWGSTTSAQQSYSIAMALDDRPIIFSYRDGAAGTSVYFSRYDGNDGAPSWTTTSFATTINPSFRMGKALSQTSFGRWYFIYCIDSTSQGDIYIRYSDDDCATWSAETFLYDSQATSAVFRVGRGPFVLEIDSDDVLHVLFCDRDPNNVSDPGALYFQFDVSPGTPLPVTLPLTTADVESVGTYSPNGDDPNDLGVHPSMHIDAQGYVYACWSAPIVDSGSATGRYYLTYNKRSPGPLGTWGTKVAVTDQTEYASVYGKIWVADDGLPRILYVDRTTVGDYRTLAVVTADDVDGSSWGPQVTVSLLEDTNNRDFFSIPQQFTRGLGHTQFASGFAGVIHERTLGIFDWMDGNVVYRSSFYTTTGPPTTAPPTTLAPTTLPPTTAPPTTPAPTLPPTTAPPTTEPPTTSPPTTTVTTPPVTLPPGPAPGNPGGVRVRTSRTVFVGPLFRRPGDPLPPPE